MGILKFNSSTIAVSVRNLDCWNISIVAEQIEKSHDHTCVIFLDIWQITNHKNFANFSRSIFKVGWCRGWSNFDCFISWHWIDNWQNLHVLFRNQFLLPHDAGFIVIDLTDSLQWLKLGFNFILSHKNILVFNYTCTLLILGRSKFLDILIALLLDLSENLIVSFIRILLTRRAQSTLC